MTRVVYQSNGATVGDGVRVSRVTDGGQTLEIMVDSKAEKFSRIILVDDDSKRTIDTFTATTFTQPGDGIRAEAAFHREFIANLSPEASVRYLLEVVEIEIAAAREGFARIKDHVPDAKRQEVYILSILWDMRPRLGTYGHIAQKIEYLSGRYPNTLAINCAVKRLRQALKTTNHPIEIITHVGMGYSLEAPKDWHAPWENE